MHVSNQDNDLLLQFLANGSSITRYLARATGSEHDAQDLSQDAWIKFSRNRATAQAAPLAYLLRIARSLSLDYKKTKARRLTTQDIDGLLAVPCEYPDALKQIEDRDQIRWLNQILDELPERRRRILLMARVEERRHVDIAEEFGVSVRTIEMEVRKALDHCFRRLQQINGD